MGTKIRASCAARVPPALPHNEEGLVCGGSHVTYASFHSVHSVNFERARLMVRLGMSNGEEEVVLQTPFGFKRQDLPSTDTLSDSQQSFKTPSFLNFRFSQNQKATGTFSRS